MFLEIASESVSAIQVQYEAPIQYCIDIIFLTDSVQPKPLIIETWNSECIFLDEFLNILSWVSVVGDQS